MPFQFGSTSKSKLVGVHPKLVAIATRAIEISAQDFSVYEGCRTVARQKQMVASGASKTMDSMHIPHLDRSGQSNNTYGHAVDLVPWIDGHLRWEWPAIYPIAAAMAEAAKEQGMLTELCWGGYWGKPVGDYAGDAAAMKAGTEAYAKNHPGPDFLDGPHFQVYRLN